MKRSHMRCLHLAILEACSLAVRHKSASFQPLLQSINLNAHLGSPTLPLRSSFWDGGCCTLRQQR